MDEYISILLVGMRVDLVVVQVGSLGFDVVGWLPDIVPEVILDGKGIKLTFFCHFRVDFSLDHAEPFWHSIQDRSAQHIDACVDVVADKLFRFLDESFNLACCFIVDDNSEPGRVFNLGQEDAAFLSMAFVVLQQLFEGVVANNVTIEDEEQAIFVALLQLLFSKLDGSCSAKGFLLLGICEFDSIFFLERGQGFD